MGQKNSNPSKINSSMPPVLKHCIYLFKRYLIIVRKPSCIIEKICEAINFSTNNNKNKPTNIYIAFTYMTSSLFIVLVIFDALKVSKIRFVNNLKIIKIETTTIKVLNPEIFLKVE